MVVIFRLTEAMMMALKETGIIMIKVIIKEMAMMMTMIMAMIMAMMEIRVAAMVARVGIIE